MHRRHDVRLITYFPLHRLRGDLPVHRLSSIVPELAPLIIGDAPPPPVISPASGIYYSDQTIVITAVPGATIYFTMDGSDPQVGDDMYLEPISFPGPATGEIRAIAHIPPHHPSLVASSTIQVIPRVAAPVITVSTDDPITTLSQHGLSCDTVDAEIFYTTDGSEPTKDSFSGTCFSIEQVGPCTIRARAFLDPWEPSPIVSSEVFNVVREIRALDLNGDPIYPINVAGYDYYVFRADGTFQHHGIAEVFALGGGGSGGNSLSYAGGGGGGAGGKIKTIVYFNAFYAMNVSIGAGAAGITAKAGGNAGGITKLMQNSYLIFLVGGGGRGGMNASGGPGGCGGGAGMLAQPYTSYPGGVGQSGFDGGKGSSWDHAAKYYACGGGGGIGGPGQNSTWNYFYTGNGGDGGVGISFSDIWPGVTGADLDLPFERFGGGGGGAGYDGRPGAGTDGGSAGGKDVKTADGVPNTGGGSGGCQGAGGSTGAGGSGLMIIRVPEA